MSLSAAAAVAVILDWHVTFEVLLYVSLLLSRLRVAARTTKAFIAAALALYGVSRIVQTVMLAHIFVVGAARMQHGSSSRAVYWISLLLVLALSGIQCYTFLIYGRLYMRCGKRAPAPRPVLAKRSRSDILSTAELGPADGLSMQTPPQDLGKKIPDAELAGGLCPAGSASLFNTMDGLLDKVTVVT